MPRPLSCIPLSLTAATMLLLAATAPQAQTLLSGDHSIDGQLCVGTDCTDTEDPAPQYGIVIKQTQPGIYFEDTSTAGFPTVDWEIVTGSSFASADDFLAIRNAQTAAHLLYLSPYAPDNAIYLDNLGQVGLGTSLPQQNLHISGGSTAGIRLEDTDMSPYAWDLNGNSVGFYVYDPQAMNIPFEIRTAAPNGALYIASNGYTGLGTRSPDAPLEVSDEIRRGVVAVPHGWGHDGKGVGWSTAAAHPGANVNLLTDAGLVDRLSGNGALNATWVRVTSAEPEPVTV